MILELLRRDGSIVVNKKLARAIGMDAAVMYAELVSKHQYFAKKGQLTEDGYFFNTMENLKEDTTLSKYQQATAIKQLVKLNLIQHENRGLPQKRYFKINEDEIVILTLLGANHLTFKSKKNEQIEVKELSSNNTKVNNSNKSNNNHIYIISNENDVFAYYAMKFKGKLNTNHPTMNKEKMIELISHYDHLSAELDIEEDRWFELVDYHFDHLSKKNNGNILSFLALNNGNGCVHRYLDDL
ncbi:hypothetical protein [Niallia oryzisoli]|uniref:hypothetical protein n=1 Tax=Niallia oryzisoli TaxID=1737571 RepID=UPI003734C60F